jgi:hypothetical protein
MGNAPQAGGALRETDDEKVLTESVLAATGKSPNRACSARCVAATQAAGR